MLGLTQNPVTFILNTKEEVSLSRDQALSYLSRIQNNAS